MGGGGGGGGGEAFVLDVAFAVVEVVVFVLEVVVEGFGGVGGVVGLVEVQGVETFMDAFPFVFFAEAGGDPGAGIAVGWILGVAGCEG